MWQRFTIYDLRAIGHYLGVLIQFSALLMIVPLITALLFSEWEPFSRYLFSIGIALAAGSVLRFCRIQPGKLNAQQALAVVGLAWIVIGLFCSIPLYFSGHFNSFLDAVFDGVSGVTTTGASLINDLDHLSYADNMFRFMMHLLGGLGLIVVALSLGIFGKRTGSSLFRSEGRNEHVVPNVINTTRFIAKVTAVVIAVSTVLLSAILLISGIEPARAALQAFWVAISGFATGGFTPMQQSILYYHSLPLEIVLMILMIMGTISFVLYAEIWKGRVKTFFLDIETRTALIWLVIMVVVITATLATSTLFSDLPTLLRRGIFMVVSSFTTTGFSVITVNQLVTVFTSGALLVLAFVMAIGGGAGSTAGGIKIYRIGIIARSIVATVKEAVSPDSACVSVSYFHNGRRILTPEVVKEAMTVCLLYVLTYVVGALVGIAHGYDATHALFESVAMTSNGGLTTGIASSGMPVSLELFYIFQMWVGRLEFITLLALAAQIIASLIPRKRTRELQLTLRNRKNNGHDDRRDGRGEKSAGKEDAGCPDGEARSGKTRIKGVKAAKTKGTGSIAFALVLALSVGSAAIPINVFGGESEAYAQDNSINIAQLPDSSFIYDASIVDLQEADSYMDGQTVQVIGEVVGDRITSEFDPGYCWITLQAIDNSYSQVTAYMSMTASQAIDSYGRYGLQGTKLQVRGVYNLACKDHEGISDLHAVAVSLVSPGKAVPSIVNGSYFIWGFFLIIASVICTFVYHRLRERER